MTIGTKSSGFHIESNTTKHKGWIGGVIAAEYHDLTLEGGCDTVAGGNGAGAADDQLKYPTGIAVDANGQLLIADQYNHCVQRCKVGGIRGSAKPLDTSRQS